MLYILLISGMLLGIIDTIKEFNSKDKYKDWLL